MDSFKREEFLNDIIEVYKKHNLSLAHEDIEGAFVIQDYKEKNIEWLKQAYFDNDFPPPIV